MQTNLKLNLLTYFNPVHSRTPENQAHAMISLSDKKGANDNHYFYIKHLLSNHGLKWKYIRFAHNSGNLFVTEGNEENGFFIGANNAVQNKQLLIEIFNFFRIPVPIHKGQKMKVNFTFSKVEEGLFILKKI